MAFNTSAEEPQQAGRAGPFGGKRGPRVKWKGGDKMNETPRASAAYSRVGHELHSCAKRRA